MKSYSFQELEHILRDYAQCGFNVLLEGTHGVGKSSLIENVFDSMGWNYLILNTPTTDPYRDLCGIPEVVVRDNNDNSERILLSVLPEKFAQDSLDAIFLDEINRSTPEILNSLMELIQFKKISGKKLNRLKAVWAAENPYNPKLEQNAQIYYVKPLDPAQKDRFHAFFTLRAEVSGDFLKKKFSDRPNDFPIIDEAVNWWNSLSEEYRQYCSPRRLEYALSVYFSMNKNPDRLYDVLGEWGELLSPLPDLVKKFQQINSESFQKQEQQRIEHLYQQWANKNKNINEIVGLNNIHLFARLIIEGKIPQGQWLHINPDVRNTLAKRHPELFKKIENGKKIPYTLKSAIAHIIDKASLYGTNELANGSFTKVLLEILSLNSKKEFPASEQALVDLFIHYGQLETWANRFSTPFDNEGFKQILMILNKMQQNAINILCFAMLCQNLDYQDHLKHYIINSGNIDIDRERWFTAFWTMTRSDLENLLIARVLTPESELIRSGWNVESLINRWRIEPPEQYRQALKIMRKEK